MVLQLHIPEDPCTSNKSKGRPLGFLYLWLKYTAAACHKDSDKSFHTDLKKVLNTEAYHDERKQARSELWAMRATHPQVLDLFALEQAPSADYLGTPELHEPSLIF